MLKKYVNTLVNTSGADQTSIINFPLNAYFINCISVIVNRSSPIGKVYLASGGLHKHRAKLVIFAKRCKQLQYSVEFYGLSHGIKEQNDEVDFDLEFDGDVDAK